METVLVYRSDRRIDVVQAASLTGSAGHAPSALPVTAFHNSGIIAAEKDP
jgi:hypothetical protein